MSTPYYSQKIKKANQQQPFVTIQKAIAQRAAHKETSEHNNNNKAAYSIFLSTTRAAIFTLLG